MMSPSLPEGLAWGSEGLKSALEPGHSLPVGRTGLSVTESEDVCMLDHWALGSLP